MRFKKGAVENQKRGQLKSVVSLGLGPVASPEYFIHGALLEEQRRAPTPPCTVPISDSLCMH